MYRDTDTKGAKQTMSKLKDLTGEVFGELTVISRTDNYVSPRGQNQTRWLCRCSCGNDTLKTSTELKSKTVTKSCGCKTPKRQIERPPLKAGEKFNNLTVVVDEYKDSTGRYLVACQCDCNSPAFEVRVDSLLSNNTKSCGCLKVATIKKASTTHGQSDERIYRIYHAMVSRCYNENHVGYSEYGGRGIKVCDRWLEPDGEGFLNFVRDIGKFYADNLTLERINTNKNYSPENCKWEGRSVQAFNRRPTRVNTSGRTGVFWYESRQRFVVKITKDGKEHWGGQYISFEQACSAASELEVKLFGFCRDEYHED